MYNNLPLHTTDDGSTPYGVSPIINLWDGTASTGIIREHNNTDNNFEVFAYLGGTPVPVGRVLVWRMNHTATTWEEYQTKIIIQGQDINHNNLWTQIHTIGTITRSRTDSVADADAHFDIQISEINKFNKVRWLSLSLTNLKSGGSGYPDRTAIGQINIRSVNNTSVGLDFMYTPSSSQDFENVGIWNNLEQFVSTPTTAQVGSYNGVDWANSSTNTITFTVTLTVFGIYNNGVTIWNMRNF